MKKIKLLIDTDMGADVDDSLALYVATKYSEVEIVGITTVFGNVKERACLVNKLLDYCGLSIPVYCGSCNTLEKTRSEDAHTMFYEEDLKKFSSSIKDGGIDFIIDCARKYAEDLVILAIGPLTNVALAIQKEPQIMAKVGKIVLMGGTFYSPTPEWNIFCDPKSAEIVFGLGSKVYCVGTDVTRKTKLPFNHQEKVASYLNEDSARGFIAKHAKIWLDTRPVGITLHDPLAFYTIIRPEWIHFKKQRVAVESKGEAAYGMTINCSLSNLYSKQKGNEIFVADYVDECAVIDELMSVLSSD